MINTHRFSVPEIRYGLYLDGATPIFEGSQSQCWDMIEQLSPAQLRRGWTIAPVPECWPDDGSPVTGLAWAGLGGIVLVLFVLIGLAAIFHWHF